MKELKKIAVIEELKPYLKINRHALDEEFEGQPSLFHKIGEAHANAVARRDYLKEQIDKVDADLYKKYRKKIEKSGDRATDTAIKMAISLDPRHQKAFNRYLNAKWKSDRILALKESFHSRSYMLRDLAGLYVANYFERTSVTDNSYVDNLKAKKKMDRLIEVRKNTVSTKSRRMGKKKRD